MSNVQLDLTNIYHNFFTDYTDVKEVPHPDGLGMVAYQLPNGKYLSFDPNGTRNTDADKPGSWERFVAVGNMAVHQQSYLKGKAVVIARKAFTVPDLP